MQSCLFECRDCKVSVDYLGNATIEAMFVPKPTFAPGDVARLKSGGPKMTVERVSEFVFCVWHNVDDVAQRSAFAHPTLEHVQ